MQEQERCDECGKEEENLFVCIIGTRLCRDCQDKQRRFDNNQLMQSLRPY